MDAELNGAIEAIGSVHLDAAGSGELHLMPDGASRPAPQTLLVSS